MYTYSFSVKRRDEDIDLEAICQIEQSNDQRGIARIISIHYDGIPWEGHLNASEKSRVEDEAFEEYLEANSNYIDDADDSYEHDSFHEERYLSMGTNLMY